MKDFYNRYKKLCIVFIVSLLLFCIYTIAGFIGIPWLLTSVIPNKLKDQNITLTIKQAKFNPYNFELNATGINLATTSEFFSLKSIDLELKFRKIFSKNINIATLNLENPSISIKKYKDNTFNFEPLITQKEHKDKDSNKSSFLNFTLDDFRISSGEILYLDESLNAPFLIELHDINYGIKDINLKENKIGKHEFQTDSKTLKKLEWNSSINLNPLEIYGDLQIDGLQMKEIWKSYLKENTDLNVTSGEIDLDIKYDLILDDKLNINLKDSTILIKNFKANDNNGTKISFSEFSTPKINLDISFKDDNNVTLDIPKLSLNDFNTNNLKFKNLKLDDINLKSYITQDKIALNLNIKDQNLSNVELNANENAISSDSFLISEMKLNSKDIKNGLSTNLKALNLNNATFKNREFQIKDTNLFINSANIFADNSFKNIDLGILNFGINAMFKGFELELTRLALQGDDLSLNLNNTDIKAKLNNLKTGDFTAILSNKKLTKTNGINVKSISFEDNLLDISSINLSKTDLFSKNKIFAGFNEATLDSIAFDIKKENLNLKNILVKEPFFNSTIDQNGAKAINDLGFKKSKNQKSSNNFTTNIQNIQIINAKSQIKHNFLKTPTDHKISIENLNISDFSSDMSKPFLVKSTIKTNESINAKISAKINLNPIDISLNLDAIASDLSKFNHIAKNYINGKISSGNAKFKGDIKFKNKLKLNATANISNLNIKDTNNSSLIKLKNLSTKKIYLTQNHLSLNQVLLKEPYFNVAISQAEGLNLLNLIKDSNTSEAKNDESNFTLRINKFDIKDAKIDFKDESLVLPFDIKIQKINTQIDKIDNKHISNLELQGVVGSGGSANILIKTNPFEPKKSSDISVKFKDIDLVQSTPYTATFVGRKIVNGMVDLDLKYDIKDSHMVGANNIKIDTIKLGEKVESQRAMSLPLSLAISVLQDSNNIIKLDLPVKGDLSNPKFSYGGIILKAILQIFTDVVTSPFRLLGNVLGIADSKALSSVDFISGDDKLLDSQSQKIADFKKITDAKPEITLLITPAYDEALDKRSLQKLMLDALIKDMSNKKDINFDEAVNKMAKKIFGDKMPSNAYEELISMQQLQPDSLETLALQRANNIKAEMIKVGIKESSIKINDKISKVKAQMQLYVPLPMGILN